MNAAIILDHPLLHNPLRTWLVLLAAGIAGYVVAFVIVEALARRAHAHAEKPDAGRGVKVLSALLGTTRGWALLVFALLLAAGGLEMPGSPRAGVGHAVFAVVGIQVALWANALVRLWLDGAGAGARVQDRNPVIGGVLRWALQIAVWTVLLLAFLDNAGVNITAFVTSLGIGGVAIALGLQNVLGDLFASMAIGLDKPFKVGDSIAFGTDSGTVERVGVKSTRLRATGGELLVVSNSNLLKEVIHNQTNRTERRIVCAFTIAHDTPVAKARALVDAACDIIGSRSDVRFDRGHLLGIGAAGIELEFVYFVRSPDLATACAIRQSVTLAILDWMEHEGVRHGLPPWPVPSPAG